jgi:hypothetical protein
MRLTPKTSGWKATLLIGGASLSMVALGCGSDDTGNTPRPPSQVELSGVITEDRVTVSPVREGAGLVLITISNQDDTAHTVTLEGESVRERVGPVQPDDTASIRKTLEPGTYTVRAGSTRAVPREIEPATLTIGPERESSKDELLLP